MNDAGFEGRLPGRNDPCPCGSGKKYKRCHLRADCAEPKPGSPPPRDESLYLTAAERDGMRRAGSFNAQLLDQVRSKIMPGARLEDLDDFVREYTYDHGHRPACLGYKGFPKSLCSSVNDVVCHGIPDGYALKEGDIVNVDLTTIVGGWNGDRTKIVGWHGDQSETFLVGDVADEARRLVQCSFDCLHLAIAAIGPGSKVGEIGTVISAHAHAQGFSVVEAFQGHGVGRAFHQRPNIPHFPHPPSGEFVLEPGVCFTIEPMINAGQKGCVVDRRDGWTALTADGKLSAQFEHTLLMTESGVEILTQTELGPRAGFKF